MERWLQRLEPGVLALVLVGAFAITLTGAYFGLFKGPLHDFQRLQGMRDEARSTLVQPGAGDSARLAAAQAGVDALRERLYGKPRATRHSVARIIGRLDGLSLRHGVDLIGVTPGPHGTVGNFSAAPYEVEASGGYFDLIAWLEDAENELRPLTVTQFEIGAGTTPERLRLRVRVVYYRAASKG